MSRPQLDDAWRRYREDQDPEARNELVQANLGLVHHLVGRMCLGRDDMERDEMLSAGAFGLMDAVASFDPSRGLAFSTFALPRIRGAILDEQRRTDVASRSVRRKERQISEARAHLSRTLARDPSPAEMAAHIGLDLDTYHRWVLTIQSAEPLSLYRPPSSGSENPAPIWSRLSDEGAAGLEAEVNLRMETQALKSAILTLSDQERTVLALYYYEEQKLGQIATVLKLSESRVSQIRSKALRKLKARMPPLRGAAA